jgi:hypothetical protein
MVRNTPPYSCTIYFCQLMIHAGIFCWFDVTNLGSFKYSSYIPFLRIIHLLHTYMVRNCLIHNILYTMFTI